MHRRIQLLRPIVNGQMRYQVQCSCGHRTNVGSRALAEGEQRVHRKFQQKTSYLQRQDEIQRRKNIAAK